VSRTALVVDGDQISRLMLRHMLTRLGYRTSEAYDVASAVASLARSRPEVVISDLLLPDGTGMDVQDALQAMAVPPALVLITDVSAWDDLVDHRFRDVPPYLTKPVSTAELENSLELTVRGPS
jgi:two-component system OmpR family response regulator